MSKRIKSKMRRNNNLKHTKSNLQEVRAPWLLGVTLCVSQLIGAAPVRLRRVGGEWTITAAPRLGKLLILWTFTMNALIGTALICDFLSKHEDRVRVGTTALSGFIACTELVFLAFVHTLATRKATEKVKQLLILLQHTQKMKDDLNFSDPKKYRILKIALVMYIIWQILSNWGFAIRDVCERLAMNNKNYFALYLYGIFYQYQNIIVAMKQLQWSLSIVEISFALIAINDRLKHLLQDSVYSVQMMNWNLIKQKDKLKLSTPLSGGLYSKDSCLEIRRLAKHYETIYETLRQLDTDYGPFLIGSFALIFLQLLITCYNFLTVLEVENGEYEIWQTNWCFYRMCNLIVMVEPCYWVLNQLELTPSLLSRLVRRVGRSDARVSKELFFFILDVKTGGPVLTPMGLFTVSRPIMASIIGSMSTYLAIIVQMQKRSEI